MLTYRQRELLTFIERYTHEHDGVCPSYQEMTAGLGLSSKSKGRINVLVKSLEERGVIRRIPKQMRAIEVVRQPRYAAFKFDDETKQLVPLSSRKGAAHADA